MKEIPQTWQGWTLVKAARIAPDVSQVPYLAVVIMDKGDGRFAVLDMSCANGQDKWAAENGAHVATLERAEEIFQARLRQRDIMTELFYRRDLMWLDIAKIRWSDVPVSGREEFEHYGRYMAGKARDFPEFYAEEHRRTAFDIEGWLSRYSSAHTHPDLLK